MSASAIANENRMFVEKLSTPAHKKQAEERLQGFLRLRVYEDSVWSKVCPPQPISPSQCDRIPSSEGNGVALLRKVIDKEFVDVIATSMDFRGKGTPQYVENDTYNVDFYKISSPIFQITEGELRAKEIPLQQMLKHAITSHIDRAIDIAARRSWIAALATTTGKDLTTDDDYILPRSLVDLVNALEGPGGIRTLEGATVVMTKWMHNQLYKWPSSDTGALVGTEYWRDGYKYPTLKGLRIVITNKSDVFPNNEVWCFAAPAFLGTHYELNDDRFEIQKDFDLIRMKGWKTHGAAVGNNEAVARMTFAT